MYLSTGTQVLRGTHCNHQSTEPRGEVIKLSSYLAIMHLNIMFAGARLVPTMQSFQREYIGGVVVRDEGFELSHGDRGINALCNGMCHFILPLQLDFSQLALLSWSHAPKN